jgi:hypothetical protein
MMPTSVLVPDAERRVGYWNDLTGVVLAEDVTTSWMQAFPYGVYKHPIYGQIAMTPERARRMADNVNGGVRGIDLAIDFDHQEGKAAGWIRQAAVHDDGLWVLVEWTPVGVEALKSRTYRYFSPEYASEWTHPKTGETYKDVLMGGGLTNKPFLKDILPVNLSEVLGGEWTLDSNGNVVFDDKIVKAKERGMDLLSELATLLGVQLSGDSSSDTETVVSALKAIFNKKATKEPVAGPDIQKLVDEHPTLKTLIERLEDQDKTIATLEAAHKLSESNRLLTEWRAGGTAKKFGLPAVLDDDVRGILLSAPKAMAESFAKVMSKIVETGLVALGEKAPRLPRPNEPGEGAEGDALKEVEQRTAELMRSANEKGTKLSEREALTILFRDDEDLYDRYRKASYAFETPGGEE